MEQIIKSMASVICVCLSPLLRLKLSLDFDEISRCFACVEENGQAVYQIPM